MGFPSRAAHIAHATKSLVTTKEVRGRLFCGGHLQSQRCAIFPDTSSGEICLLRGSELQLPRSQCRSVRIEQMSDLSPLRENPGCDRKFQIT